MDNNASTISVGDVYFFIDENEPPHPTGFLDYIVLAVIVLVSIYFFLNNWYMWKKRATWAPIRGRNPAIVIAMSVASCIHIWSVFIDNDHLSALKGVANSDCSIWGFWFQYMFGLNLWFMFMTMRLLTYGFIFENHMRVTQTNAKQRYRRYVALLYVVPMLMLCTAITITKGTRVSETTQACQASPIWKGIITGWVGVCIVIMAVLASLLKKVRQRHFNEWATLRSVVFCAILFLALGALLNFLYLTVFMLGRFLFTMFVVIAHTYAYIRITLPPVYACLRRDTSYLEAYNSEIMPIRVTASDTIPDILDDAVRRAHFLQFVRSRGPFEVSDPLWPGSNSLLIRPAHLADLYRDIKDRYIMLQHHHQKGGGGKNDAIVRATKHLAETHLLTGSPAEVPIPNTLYRQLVDSDWLGQGVLDPNLFVGLEKWIVDDIFTKYFLAPYSSVTDQYMAHQMREDDTVQEGLLQEGLVPSDAIYLQARNWRREPAHPKSPYARRHQQIEPPGNREWQQAQIRQDQEDPDIFGLRTPRGSSPARLALRSDEPPDRDVERLVPK